MRTKAIKTLTEKTGDAEMAGAIWDMFVSKAFAGREPSEAMFKMLPKEKALEAMPVGFHGPLTALWPETPEAQKGRKFKAGRPYGAAEYSAFYAKTPEDAALVADIAHATDGKPWVIAPEGKFCEGPSAKYIQWHMDQEIAPATTDVGGVPVAPVMPGEERRKEAKEYPVDPHTPGGFLDVEGKSPRTHADFAGYSEEEIQATIMAYPKLARMDDLSLQNLTLANRGKGAAAILKPFPEIAAAWAAMKPKDRPCAKAPKRPFVEPLAPEATHEGNVARHATSTQRVFVFGVTAAGNMWPELQTALAGMRRRGVKFESDADAPPGTHMLTWHPERVRNATMFIVLLTSTFAASPELDEAEALQAAGHTVVPVLLRPLDLSYSSIGRLKTIPDDRPVSQYGDKDAAYHIVAREIDAILKKMAAMPAQPARQVWNDAMRDSVYRAIVSSGVGRVGLFAGIDNRVTGSITASTMPNAQTLLDISYLAQLHSGGDSVPLRTYLTNGAQLTGGRRENAAFREALAALGR